MDEGRRVDEGAVGGEREVGGVEGADAGGDGLSAEYVPALFGDGEVEPEGDEDAAGHPPVPACADAALVARDAVGDAADDLVGEAQRLIGRVELYHISPV